MKKDRVGRMFWQLARTGPVIALAVILVRFAAVPVAAQTPTPTPTPTLSPTVSSPYIVPTKDETVTRALGPQTSPGDKSVYWTLRDAILMALDNNVDVAIDRKNLRIAEFAIQSAQGVYEPLFVANPSFTSAKQPNIGRFSGVGSNINSTDSTNLSLNAGINKLIQTGGGSFTSSFDNPRITSNSGIVSPVYSPQLSFGFTQPLWRNRVIDNNRLQIFVAKKNLTLTTAQFKQQVMGVIFQVQQAYWNLAFAVRNVSVQTDGVALAQKQIDDNQKQVDVGMLAPIDVITARATLEVRLQALIQAENAVSQAQNILKNLVASGTDAPIWNREIFPTDFFELQSPTSTLTDALRDGYTSRPEVDQFQVQKDINRLNIKYLRNQTKPQVDLVSSYSITGAGGTPTTSLSCPAGTTLANNNLCSPGNLPPTIVTANVNSTFIGGYPKALENMLTNKYNTFSIGLNISLPFHNKTAEANLGRSLAIENQTELQERKQLQTIEVDVRNAFQTVANAKRNLDAARLSRQYAETQLDAEQKKFASGLSTTFLVLTRQNELIQARGAEVNGLAAYNNAIAALQQATGTTLTSNNIEIK